ncbi:MAG: hypothetical protein F2656_00990 [Actinobacteria bacterium]|nr:hypothetical protein [Actinomycetota bacterium]
MLCVPLPQKEAMSTDIDFLYRPGFHFTPAKNWMNDPNGLVFHKGEYHLFYQHNPFGTKWGHMSWGHAVSTDLLNWKHLDIAISEDADGAIFSGSAVSIGDEIVAIYTRHTETNQTQCIATSKDNGRTFTKFESNPVLDLDMADFRDPKVFRYEDQWIMAVVKPHEHVCVFYKSIDLIKWEFLSEFGPAAAIGGVWECPDLFPLTYNGEELWVLLISLNPGAINNGTGTQYFVGSFDGVTFRPKYPIEKPRWLDHGRDNYAGATFNDAPDGRRIFIGWMANWQDLGSHPATSWTNAMTIPRELGLTKIGEEIVLTQQPLCSPTYELIIDTTKKHRSGLTGFVELGYDPSTQKIFVDNYTADVKPVNNRIHLKVLVDQSSVELYTKDGVCWITMAVFPQPGVTRELTNFG